MALLRHIQPLLSRHLRLLSCAVLLLIEASPIHFCYAELNGQEEYRLKTAFIYQFTNYIEWPQKSKDDQSPFVISIIGDSSIVPNLKKLAAHRKVNGRKIEINSVSVTEKIKKSDILIIAIEDEETLQTILSSANGTGALTVSHAEGFGKKGVMINFFLENNRLRFEVNRKALEKEKMKIGSQLLKLSKLIE